MAFLHEGVPCGMSSLRSDTLTMRVTGVRITVFCSAIVIDVIVHCHTAGALLSQTAENNCPYHRVVGFLILSGQFIITNSDSMLHKHKCTFFFPRQAVYMVAVIGTSKARPRGDPENGPESEVGALHRTCLVSTDSS